MCNKVVTSVLLMVLMGAASVVQAAGEADGVLQWEQKTALSLPVSGVIKAINVTPGQRVAKGDVLLSLDRRSFQYRLESAQARMEEYAPGRDEAHDELQRAEELYERTVLSQVELDQAQNDFAAKDARYLAASADVGQAKLDLEHTELKAPFELIVLKNHVVVGQTVVNRLQATPLITVANGQLVAVMRLSPEKIMGLNISGDANVTTAGQTYPGKVRVIDYDPGAGLAEVTIAIDARPPATVGQLARITW